MAGGQTAQSLGASKPVNYRWIAPLKLYLSDLCEVMEHMTMKGFTVAENVSSLSGVRAKFRVTMEIEINREDKLGNGCSCVLHANEN